MGLNIATPDRPRRVDFLRTKYGRDFLLDAAWVSEMPSFDVSSRPYVLNFFDILLVTEGAGRFGLDGEDHTVAPGALLLTRPGEVRRWRVRGLDGACVFFTGEFLRETFSDTRFIERFAYWREGRPSGGFRLTRQEQRQFLSRFAEMRREFDALRDDAAHLLRARLYEMLVLLDRWYAKRFGESPTPPPNEKLERFLAAVQRDFASGRGVADHADALGLTPGHLNALCRTNLGRSAGALIRDRIVLEAKRRLLYTAAGVASIGYDLGFADPAYFTRFFRRETGRTPGEFRRGHGR